MPYWVDDESVRASMIASAPTPEGSATPEPNGGASSSAAAAAAAVADFSRSSVDPALSSKPRVNRPTK